MFADKDLILDIDNPGTWAVLSIASVLMVSIYALASVQLAAKLATLGTSFDPTGRPSSSPNFLLTFD